MTIEINSKNSTTNNVPFAAKLVVAEGSALGLIKLVNIGVPFAALTWEILGFYGIYKVFSDTLSSDLNANSKAAVVVSEALILGGLTAMSGLGGAISLGALYQAYNNTDVILESIFTENDQNVLVEPTLLSTQPAEVAVI